MDQPVTDRQRDKTILLACALGLCGLFGYYLFYIAGVRVSHGHDGDFPTFYDAGRAVRNHTDPYVPPPGGMYYVYPPLFAVLCVPLSYLSIVSAERVFVAINVAAAVASLLIGARETLRRFGASVAAPGIFGVALLAGILAENDMRGELQAMETDVLILLMFTLALHWLDRKPLRAGAALAFAMNIKYLSLIALPYLLLRRRWRAAGGMVGWTIGFALLPAIVLGWNENLRCLKTALGGLLGWVGHHSTTARANVHGITDGLSVSVTSAIARFYEMVLRNRGMTKPDALTLAQPYALKTAAALGLMMLGATWLMYRRRGLPMWRWPSARGQESQPFLGLVALEWAAVMVVTLAFSPDTNTRHLSMFTMVYVTAAALLLVPRAGVSRWPVLVGVIIAFVGLILPTPPLTKYPFGKAYFRWSGCGWSILAMYALMLSTGLRYIRSITFPFVNRDTGVPPVLEVSD